MGRLTNAEVAAEYLNVTMEESPENFLTALRARQMAKHAGVKGETHYNSVSAQGNATLSTLSAVLGALG
jgi:DNA-binding phage protein